MQGKTHIVGGLAAGLLTAGYAASYDPTLAPTDAAGLAVCLCASVVGSLAPDIDLHASKAGHAAGAMSWVIQLLFGHRTLFHSPLLVLILYVALNQLFPAYHTYIIYFLVGMISHLVLDMCNKKGIPLLYPFPKRFHIASIKTGSAGESVVALLLLCSSVLLLVYQIFI